MNVCDCVPSLSVLTKDRRLIPKQQQVVALANRALTSQLASAMESFAARPAFVLGDAQLLFLEQKALIARGERARNADLEQAGLKLDPLSIKPEPVILSTTKVEPDKLIQLKVEKLRQLVNSEAPRETISGSFRAH